MYLLVLYTDQQIFITYQHNNISTPTFPESPRGTAIEVSGPETIFMAKALIDDIDMKWSHGREALTAFLDEANNFHPSIKFTAEISTEQHVFLDTKSSLVGDTISANRYTKPTEGLGDIRVKKGPSLAFLSDKENPVCNERIHQSLICNSVFFLFFVGTPICSNEYVQIQRQKSPLEPQGRKGYSLHPKLSSSTNPN